jgi:ElaB/YqjD/DUF883 family membrane-anchored ribosome-binding protein
MKIVKSDLDKRLSDLKAQVDDVQRKAAKTVKEQPLLSLGVAFVLGMAIGIALANTGD